MPRHSLARRLSYLLIACIAGMTLVTTLIDYHLSRAVILEQVANDTNRTINDTRNDLDNQLSSVAQATQLFGELLAEGQYDAERLRQKLQTMVNNRTDIYGAAIALAPEQSANGADFAGYFYRPTDGPVRYRDLRTTMPDYAAKAWFTRPQDTGRPAWSEPYYDRGGGETLMATYSVPLYRSDAEGRVFMGVVTADLALTSLSGQLEGLKLGQAGFALLVSRAGKILAGPADHLLMLPLVAMLPEGQDPMLWQTMLDSANGAMAMRSAVPCIRQQGDCRAQMIPLATTGWTLGVYYSATEMLAPLRGLLLRMALSELGSLIVVLVLVVFLSRQLTRPLAALAAVTNNIARGNLDAPMPRTVRDDEVGQLVRSFGTMQTNLRQHIDDLQRETASRNRIEGELDAARDIQYSMLPDAGSSRVYLERASIWAELRPARSVGGDFYWYRSLGNRLLLVVGDVSDKGVPAALFMSRAMTLLQQLASPGIEPPELIATLNDELCSGNDNCMFVTLFCGVIELEQRQLRFSSGGHTPPSLVRGGHANSIEQDTGPALGLQEGLEFPLNTLSLEPGDRLAIFTDGIDEAFNSNSEQLGLPRFNTLLAEGQAKVLEQAGAAALAGVDAHAAGTPQSDDISLLLLDVLPDPDATLLHRITGNAATAAKSTAPATITAGTINRLLDWLQQASSEVLPARAQGELMLAAEEAVSNALKYGRLAATGDVTAQLLTFPAYAVLQISDAGTPFDPLRQARGAELGASTETAAIGGLGVHLLQALTDHQSYQRQADRNILRLTKYLDPAEASHGTDHTH